MKLVDEGTSVHIKGESITPIGVKSNHLSNDNAVEPDAIIFATDWLPFHNALFSDELAVELGLPVSPETLSLEDAAYWYNQDLAAESEVSRLYPALRKASFSPRPCIRTPRRLFRTLVPSAFAAAGDRSPAFVGLVSNNQVVTHAKISGLWAAAYLDGRLDAATAPVSRTLAGRERMCADVARMSVFMRRRYLGRKAVPDAAMEIQDYTDRMMCDLDLRGDWKRARAAARGWLEW